MSNINTFFEPTKDPNYHRPFIYVFDASGLADGSSYTGLIVQMEGDYPFTMRRFSGLPTCTVTSNLLTTVGMIQIYDSADRPRFSDPIRAFYDFPFMPGVTYPALSRIKFDLFRVQRSSNQYIVVDSVPNYTSQLIFQGVKHVWSQGPGYQTPYPFYEKPQVYFSDFTLTDSGRVAPAYQAANPAIQFTVPIFTRDFELLKVVILSKLAGQSQFTPSTGNISLEMYDAMGFPVQNLPVMDHFINYLDTTYCNGWPQPTMIWPANGEIRFKVTNLMIDTSVPATFRIEFHGINRFPFGTNNAVVQMPNVSGA